MTVYRFKVGKYVFGISAESLQRAEKLLNKHFKYFVKIADNIKYIGVDNEL